MNAKFEFKNYEYILRYPRYGKIHTLAQHNTSFHYLTGILPTPTAGVFVHVCTCACLCVCVRVVCVCVCLCVTVYVCTCVLTALKSITDTSGSLVFNQPKRAHVTPLLIDLHWLPVAARIKFKSLLLAYRVLDGSAPTSLHSLVRANVTPRM